MVDDNDQLNVRKSLRPRDLIPTNLMNLAWKVIIYDTNRSCLSHHYKVQCTAYTDDVVSITKKEFRESL